MDEPKLWRAAHDHRITAARWCLDSGNNVDLRGGKWKSTPLLEAAGHANPGLLLLLLTHRADIQATDDLGYTALHYAARDGSVKCARILIAKGADVNAVNRNLRTPLIAAAKHADSEFLLLLLTHGADIQAADDDGYTALHYATRYGNVKCAQILTALGADLNAVDRVYRSTPVMEAAWCNRVRIARVLTEAGADLSLRDVNRNAALDLAERSGYQGTVSAIKDLAILHWGNSALTDSELKSKLKSLPHGKKYSVLLVHGNSLTSIPDLTVYPQLAQLQVLNVSGNKLTEVTEDHIPSSVVTVYIGGNKIPNLTPRLERDWMHWIYHIITNSNQTQDRRVILQDKEILSNTLHWNESDLTERVLQDKILKLDKNYRCSILLINNSNLKQLPDLNKYPQFSELKLIDASHNQLTDVSDKHLPDSVQIVHLGNNRIQTMSPSLVSDWLHSCCEMKESAKREINLNGNTIGENFNQLWIKQGPRDKVQKLLFPNHNIKTIDVAKLPKTVEEVNLNNNNIEDLTGMKAMTSLKQILLDHNNFHTFPEFSDKLVHINLDNNSLQSIKSLSYMKRLKYLTVKNNKLGVIFGVSSSLQSIHLQGNPIRILHKACFPSERVYRILAGALTSDQIDALQQPPPQVFRRGFRSVIQYYEQSDISGLQNNSKNRMCLLGEARAGKTSLMQSLMSGVPCLTAEDDRTQVVDTHTWNITDKCSYQIFDQGGHPIYSITNMFFMSANSKNIICHNIRDGSMKVTLDVLKRTVHLHPTSDIHFGLTKSDLLTENQSNAKMKEFQSKLNKTFQTQIDFFEKLLTASKFKKLNNQAIEKVIQGYKKKIKESRYFLLSSKQYKGIFKMKQFLCELAERDMKTLPELWWKCYTHIDRLEINVLKLKEFKDIFQARQNLSQKLKSKFKLTSSQKNILSCLQLYNDCGLVLWLEDHPQLKNYIFCQLQYIINILKALFHHALEVALDYQNNSKLQSYFHEIDFHEAIAKYQQEGLLSYKFLSYLWQEYQLATFDQNILLELIKSFDICYQIEDKPQIENTLYYFPWFTKNNQIPAALNLLDLCVVNDKTLTLLLECVFFDSVPVNLTEMFIVCLQRHAVENHYLGRRYAWENGLLVTVGNINIYVIRHSAKSTIYLGIRGEVEDLFEMWKAFAALHKSLRSIVVQWHGVVRSLHVVCPHCVLIGSNPPHFWPTSKVFPDYPCSLLRVSCEKESAVSLSGDRSSTIPAALVTLVDTDHTERHIQEVRQYLQMQWKGMGTSKSSVENTSQRLESPSLMQRQPQLNPALQGLAGVNSQCQQEHQSDWTQLKRPAVPSSQQGHQSDWTQLKRPAGPSSQQGHQSDWTQLKRPAGPSSQQGHQSDWTQLKRPAGPSSQQGHQSDWTQLKEPAVLSSQQGHQSDWTQLKKPAGPSSQQVHQHISGSVSDVIPKQKQARSVTNQVARVEDSRRQQQEFQQQMLSQGRAVAQYIASELQQVKCNQTKILSQITEERQQLGDEIRTERQQLSVQLNEDKQDLVQQLANQGKVLSDQMFLQGRELSRSIALDAGDASQVNLTYSHPVLQSNKARLERHLNVTIELLHHLVALTVISGDQHKKIEAQTGEGGKQKLLLYCLDLSVIEDPGLIHSFIQALHKYGGNTNALLATTLVNSCAEDR